MNYIIQKRRDYCIDKFMREVMGDKPKEQIIKDRINGNLVTYKYTNNYSNCIDYIKKDGRYIIPIKHRYYKYGVSEVNIENEYVMFSVNKE